MSDMPGTPQADPAAGGAEAARAAVDAALAVDKDGRKVFEIALAMSGAISAGAYSAGVLDFLVEALDAWEARRAVDPSVPQHRVCLKVMTGASAGAITAGIGAIALTDPPPAKPIEVDPGDPTRGSYRLERLYRTWVARPALVAGCSEAALLTLYDLGNGQKGESKSANSVLDCTVLDEIATEALQKTLIVKRSYVADRLHLYMTLANLRGIPYKVDFRNGEFPMMTHADRAHYMIEGGGSWTPTPSPFADTDPGWTISLATLINPTPGSALAEAIETKRLPSDTPSDDWTGFARTTLASAAFPLGLVPRWIQTDRSQYRDIRMPLGEGLAGEKFNPDFPDALPVKFAYASVDGGLINNDPFDYAHEALVPILGGRNPPSDQDAVRAVIMVAPFPEPPEFLGEGLPPLSLAKIWHYILTALRNQVRFKPEQVVTVGQLNRRSRFIISPSRSQNDIPEPFGIASGLLGGFGGFFLKVFREHDYQLGRRNCQQFLREHFKLAPTHPLFGPPTVAPANGTPPVAPSNSTPPGQGHIIPLFDSAYPKVPLQPWPRMSWNDLEATFPRLKTRLGAVVDRLVATEAKTATMKLALMTATKLAGNRIFDFVRWTIRADFIRRDQLKDWTPPILEVPGLPGVKPRTDPELRRDYSAVIAALADPAFDFRTADGIAEAVNLPVSFVAAVLDDAVQATGKPYQAWRATWDGKLYTLQIRRPDFVTSWLQGRSAPLFAKPVTN